MVSNPGPHYHDPTRQHRAELDDLHRAVRSVVNRVPFPFQVNYDPSGIGTPPFVPMFSVQNSGYVDSNGHPVPVTTMQDAQGNIIFSQYPATLSGGGAALSWYWALQDMHSTQVVATDGLSGKGLAYPYIPVHLSPLWNTLTSSAAGYATIQASNIATSTILWQGVMGYVSHPAIRLDGVWGQASGVDANAATYTLQVNGVTTGTWTAGPNALSSAPHIFDIHTLVGTIGVGVTLSVKATTSNTDLIAAQVFGCHMCQTPTVFG